MAKARREREVPRSFQFHWGGGQIVEEAAYIGEHTEPAIQLLEYEGHPGSYGIRFCYHNHDGRFQRSPMMIDDRHVNIIRAIARYYVLNRAQIQRLCFPSDNGGRVTRRHIGALLEHGMLDAVVPRKELKAYISRALDFMSVTA